MNTATQRNWNRSVLAAGLLCAFVFIFLVDLVPGNALASRTAAVAIVMALWWITGALPLAATALIPLFAFPLLGVMSAGDVAAQFANDTIYLFFGGFMVALAMQYWDLHRRIALRLLLLFGVRPGALLLGFMAPTFLISMWISNTATAMMMTPIALSIVMKMEEQRHTPEMARFATGLLLAIAYSASIGGIATLIGTPPNLSLVRIFAITFPDAPEIDFVTWFIFAFPLSVSLLLLLWGLLVWRYAPKHGALSIDSNVIREQYAALGKTTCEQWVVLAVFLALAVLWLTRGNIAIGTLQLTGWAAFFPNPAYVRDGTVAVAMAVLLFVIPSRAEPGRAILDWKTASQMPWDILLLFGGGFALAQAFSDSGLALAIGQQLTGLSGYSPLFMLVVICLCVTFLTELTSNAATTEMLLPIMASLGVAMGMHPLFLMVPVTITCSCAFMLPVATPPNAIVFASGQIRVAEMARTGLILNLAGVAVVCAFMMLLGTRVFGIAFGALPSWAHL
ncbi:MAG: SLC13/DASS family transporter [Candidatus Hydrogenedentes bacterium]|nr:SLC13/DASS family transporter [Candidatus Hydrogenedentota bacterium]